ncbi:MAG: hypothetical protein JHC84_17800 [Solirubrobacteraceae bacterium]|nr:hypothetical protein [Solirubrobacteraceae bacterium]
MTAGPSIAYGCAAEPTADWVDRVALLAWSLRNLGGTSADAPLHACFAGPTAALDLTALRELDVRVHEVAPFDARISYANKLRLLELDLGGADALAMLDCDIVVAGDPAPLLAPHAARMAAKPADQDPLDVAGWARLCSALEIAVPPRDAVATCTGAPMPRYANSGVVVVPAGAVDSVRDRWRHWLYRVVDVLQADPLVVPRARRLFADQYALMAVLAERSSAMLPVAANCPTHVGIHRSVDLGGEPALLHYHARMWPSTLLQRPVAPSVRPAAARFNSARAAALGITDPGLREPPGTQRLRGAARDVGTTVRATRSFTRVHARLRGGRRRIA